MTPDDSVVKKIRSFNRFYTNIIGVVDRHILDSPHSLTEARVLYEIRSLKDCSARKIIENVKIDEGYLSRIIARFIKKGLVKKSRAPGDRRKRVIVLTRKGKKEFERLNRNSSDSIYAVLEKLSVKKRRELVRMMDRIEALLREGRSGKSERDLREGR